MSGIILACTRMVQSMTRDLPFAYCVEQNWIIPLTRVPHASIVICSKYTEMYGKKSLLWLYQKKNVCIQMTQNLLWSLYEQFINLHLKCYTFLRKEDHDKMRINRSRVHQFPLGEENIKIKEERQNVSIGHCPGVARGAWKHAPIISLPKSIMHLKHCFWHPNTHPQY